MKNKELCTTRTHYDGGQGGEQGLCLTLREIGWDNVLEVIPCYCGNGEYFYTIIYAGEVKDGKEN